MDGTPPQGMRARDIPNQLMRLSAYLEVLEKNISELSERVKPILSQHPVAKLEGKKEEGLASNTAIGNQIIELSRKLIAQNDRLEDIITSLEV